MPRDSLRFVGLVLALAAVSSCGSDSGVGGSPADGEGPPAYAGDGMGAGGSAGEGNTTVPPAQMALDESSNEGVDDDVPIVGNIVGNGGASGGGATAPDDSQAGSAAAGGAAATAGAGGMTSGMGGSAPAVPDGSSVFPSGVTRPRIMIIGDSISAGPGCYKKYLLANLSDNDYSSFEFVGQYADDCGGGVRHSAVSCSTAEQFTQPSFTMPNCAQGTTFSGLSTLAAEHRPDLVMLQLGVNDVWNGRTPEAILANYTTLVQQARAQNPNVVVVVAQIAQMRPDCSTSDVVFRRAESLINAVPGWAQSVSQTTSPVLVADLWTNSNWMLAETLDCVHPNDQGAQRMGLNWFNALRNVLTPN